MSWTAGCSASSNDELVHRLAAAGIVTSPEVQKAMLATDRALYTPRHTTPEANRGSASRTYQYGPYADAPQSIGSKATISAPYIHATCLEILREAVTAPGCRVLDVGSGSGILLAYMARMAAPSTTLVGVEIVQRLVDASIANLRSDGFDVGDPPADGRHCRIEVRVGDGWQGAAEYGPYDAINVGAGAAEVPVELLRQLKPGGLLLIPLGAEQSNQALTRVVRGSEPQVAESTEVRTVRFVPLVDSSRGGGSSEVDWNARYRKGWAYGKQPNAFLVQAAARWLLPSPRVLSLGEGQGRNAVHLASDLRATCIAVDASSVGLAKARRLAKQRGVGGRLQTICADLTTFRPDCCPLNEGNGDANDDGGEGSKGSSDGYDVLVSIFCMLEPAQRRRLHSACAAVLRPGAVVLIECFAPSHAEKSILVDGIDEARRNAESQESDGGKIGGDGNGQSWPWCPGPPRECLVSWEELAADFSGLRVLVGEEVEAVLHEGGFHRGRARLTRFVATKPCLDAKTAEKEAQLTRSVSYRRAVDEVFVDGAKHLQLPTEAPIVPATTTKPTTGDALLDAAKTVVAVACSEADRSGWCRYCWTPTGACFCDELITPPHSSPDSISANDHDPSPRLSHQKLRFVVVSHPAEFLRSTSSARVAVPTINAAGPDHGVGAELLVLGSPTHEARLDSLLLSSGSSNSDRILLLFPPPVAETANNDQHESRLASLPCTLNATEMVCTNNVDGGDESLTVIVPDGSWCAARAMVTHLQRRRRQLLGLTSDDEGDLLPYVALKESTTAAHVSPLIEALKPGQGRGRLSTLEAMALFLGQADRPEVTSTLLASLDPLVHFVRRRLSARDGLATSAKKDTTTRHFSRLVGALQAEAARVGENGPNGLPPGVSPALRLCAVCGENMATPSRMGPHLRSRPHCSAVAKHAIMTGTTPETRIPSPSEQPTPDECDDGVREWAEMVIARYSTAVLSSIDVEPPDAGLVAASTASINRSLVGTSEEATDQQAAPKLVGFAGGLSDSVPDDKTNTCDNRNVVAEGYELAGLHVERPEGLPASMRTHRALRFDPELCKLAEAAVALLTATPAVGHFPAAHRRSANAITMVGDGDAETTATPSAQLETFAPAPGMFTSFKARQTLYNAVAGNSDGLLPIYEDLVREVVCPFLKTELLQARKVDYVSRHGDGDGGADEETVISFWYQHPPSMRLQPGPSDQAGGVHCDLEYGHQPGELNFWLPLTETSCAAGRQTTLRAETSPGLGDFREVLAGRLGEVAIFHGALCRHYAPANPTTATRCSLDFRIGIDGYFDPTWRKPGLPRHHGWRRLDI